LTIGTLGVFLAAVTLMFTTGDVAALGYNCSFKVSAYHTESFAEVDVSNTPLDSPVGDGTYPAWCLEQEKGLDLSGATTYTATLYDSYGADVSGLGFTYVHDWNRINYVLNHKGTLDWSEMQGAVWQFCGYPYLSGNPLVDGLIADANANGGDYVPTAEGDVQGYVLFVDGTHQSLIIEVPYAVPPTPPDDGGCGGDDDGGSDDGCGCHGDRYYNDDWWWGKHGDKDGKCGDKKGGHKDGKNDGKKGGHKGGKKGGCGGRR
jgi:hypothetical protein